MTYDGNGNPTTYGGKTLTFDVENRVTSVGSDATHGYRSDGLRAWKQPYGQLKTYYLYDGGNPIVELDASGAVANVNVFAPDGLVARKEGSTWNQFVFDLQGNTVQKLTTSQSVSATRLTDAWGQGVETTVPRQIDPFLFNGKWGYYYDRETALYLCQHRMYDASAGRWINRDPIGYAGGLNLYGYCGSGPVGSADPSGYVATIVEAGVVAAVVVAIAAMFLSHPDVQGQVHTVGEDIGRSLSHIEFAPGRTRICEPTGLSDRGGSAATDFEQRTLLDPAETGPFFKPMINEDGDDSAEIKRRVMRDLIEAEQPLNRRSRRKCDQDYQAAMDALRKLHYDGILDWRERVIMEAEAFARMAEYRRNARRGK